MNFRSAHRRRAWTRLSRAAATLCRLRRAAGHGDRGARLCGLRPPRRAGPGGQRRSAPRYCAERRQDRPARRPGRAQCGSRRAGNRQRCARFPQPRACSAGKRTSSSWPAATDRWGRTVADLSLPDSAAGSAGSTAAALLAAGLARVRPEFETRGCAAERLAIEDGARRAALGIWRDPDFAVIQSSNSAELRRRDGRFVVVEGMVRRVGFARSRLYLELVPHDGPTIVIARKLEPALAREGRPVGALVGRRSGRAARSMTVLVRESRSASRR